MPRTKKTMDGNTAAAHASYAFTEVAAIYPITPSSPMAEITDTWSASGLKNIFGDEVSVIELQSEAGAAGAVHGSLNAGALTTTYTASQGLLLMIPNMYKMAGELLPAVINCSARTVATHALSIFGDHGDIYSCRQTGFAMLAESNPQEVMDLTPVAHLAAIKSRVPFLNFFDGFRTSHELQKIETWDYDELAGMIDKEALAAFRARALNPEHPTMRGSHQNPDIFFQNREAANKYYEAVPGIVEHYMGEVNKKLGTDYGLFNYYGAPDADRVIIAMGSFCDVTEEVIDYLMAAGEKVGLVKVRLYRPFCADKLLEALPKTVKKIAVMDRTKEPGALGEPLYIDVLAGLAGKTNATIVGGRYGLSSKDTQPQQVFAVYENLAEKAPKNNFTVGINDDVTNLSLPMRSDCADTTPAGTVSCKFFGLGGDGTVGANKNSIKIIGDHTDKYVQAYFQYDSKKTGGVTISHLRFGDKPIKAPYYVTKADFVACHTPSYITKGLQMVRDVKPGGKFLVSAQWTPEELAQHLHADAKRYIAENNVEVYLVNAIDIARDIGMGKRTNTILQSAFFKLANVIPIEDAVKYMKDAAHKSYAAKGDAIVESNYKAIDAGVDAIVKLEIPADWKTASDKAGAQHHAGQDREAIRASLKSQTEALLAVDWTVPALKEAAQKWLDTYNDEMANAAATEAYIAQLADGVLGVDEAIEWLGTDEGKAAMGDHATDMLAHMQALKAKGETNCDCDACSLAARILAKQEYLAKPQDHEAIRARLKSQTEKLITIEHGLHEDLKAAAEKWLASFDDDDANDAATEAFITEMNECIVSVDYSLNIAENVMSKEYREANYPGVLEALLAAKERGETVCQCAGCQAANAIFKEKKHLYKKLDHETARARLKRKTEKLVTIEHGVHEDLRAAAQKWLATFDDVVANAAAAAAYIAEMNECIADVDYSLNIVENVMPKEYQEKNYPGVPERLRAAKERGETLCQCDGCLLADSIRSEKEHLAKQDDRLETMVHAIMQPVNLNDGDSIPVSAFVDHVDGTFEQGAAAFEKRGVAVDVPEWQADKCIQCNQCAYVCPHATIRPFALDAADMAGAPKGIKTATMKGKGVEQLQFTQAISPLDCMGCGVCAQVCPAPGKALVMKGQESQLAEQEIFDWCVDNVGKKDGMMSETSVKGSQFNQPLLEFSGSCAGCAETAYARLVTQLYGERMYISNATGCSSIWGGPAATSPYTVSKKNGHGPAWANSLFEDNAENGYGLYLGQKAIRARLKRKTEKLIAMEHGVHEDLKAAAQKWLDTYDDGEANAAASVAYAKELDECIADIDYSLNIAQNVMSKEYREANYPGVLEKLLEAKERGETICQCPGCLLADEIRAEKDYLAKKSVWIFGGDGWAYDIGYGGLDHVLASGEDVNVFVFDTEVYSNTGGQASKASQVGQVAQFAAAGKNIGKKSLAEMAMAYGYVYVAQIAMGADQNQTIKAIAEAESYPGPSLIIGYAPCEMHGIKGGMVNCQSEMKKAVQAGYWFNFRFDPRKVKEGKNPFTLDSKEPTGDYLEFIEGETRYSSLKLSFPDRADKLFAEAVDLSKDRYAYLQRLGALYEPKA